MRANPDRTMRRPKPPNRISVAQSKNGHRSVVEIMAQRIISGHYPQGAQVPAVETLAEEFAVSRTLVREAMRVLSAKGFVVARQRAGTHVRPRRDWSLLDRTVLQWLFTGSDSQDLGDHLLVLRRIMEPEAAALAATNGNGADIAALESAFQRMCETLPLDVEACCRADVDFHVALFVATGNVFFGQFANLIRTALLVTFEKSTRLADSHAEALSLHGAIVEDVRRRDPQQARAHAVALLSVADRHLHSAPTSGLRKP